MSNDSLIQTGPLTPTAGSIIGEGKTLQQIQTPYQTAVSVQKPRDLQEVRSKCLIEASLAGESCFYGWGNGKDRVEGPSIVCAMIAARNFCNLAVVTRDPIETATSYILNTDVIDVETGFTYNRPFRQSKKWTVYGKMDEVRKEDVRFQIGVSKSQRNAILRVMPGWLIDSMIEKAKEGVREKIEEYIRKNSIEGARKRVLDGLARFGVSLERIEDKYEKKYNAWDIEVLVLLAGDLRALTDKIDSPDVVFPLPEVKVDPSTGEILNGEYSPKMEPSGLSPEAAKPGDPATHTSVAGALPLDDKKTGGKK